MRRSCFWMNPPPAWTRKTSGLYCQHSTGWRMGGRCWSPPTARPASAGRIGGSRSAAAGWRGSMRDLWPFLKLFRRHAFRMAFGALLMLATLLAGIGLLGVSGWFITGSALAGLGLGAAGFNIFTPSAGIRAAALIRTAGRYAERLVNHEATFRLLADLRRWLFAKAIPLDTEQVSRLTGGDLLTRLTADIEALDNLYLRVVAPSLVAVV